MISYSRTIMPAVIIKANKNRVHAQTPDEELSVLDEGKNKLDIPNNNITPFITVMILPSTDLLPSSTTPRISGKSASFLPILLNTPELSSVVDSCNISSSKCILPSKLKVVVTI
ncbi:hypothetical protein D3C75_774610 [compost metagenome]